MQFWWQSLFHGLEKIHAWEQPTKCDSREWRVKFLGVSDRNIQICLTWSTTINDNQIVRLHHHFHMRTEFPLKCFDYISIADMSEMMKKSFWYTIAYFLDSFTDEPNYWTLQLQFQKQACILWCWLYCLQTPELLTNMTSYSLSQSSLCIINLLKYLRILFRLRSMFHPLTLVLHFFTSIIVLERLVWRLWNT